MSFSDKTEYYCHTEILKSTSKQFPCVLLLVLHLRVGDNTLLTWRLVTFYTYEKAWTSKGHGGIFLPIWVGWGWNTSAYLVPPDLAASVDVMVEGGEWCTEGFGCSSLDRSSLQAVSLEGEHQRQRLSLWHIYSLLEISWCAVWTGYFSSPTRPPS